MANKNIVPMNEQDDNLGQLIRALEAVNIDKLKRVSYNKYSARILEIAKRALAHEGTCLSIIIEHVKSFKSPCFQRDVSLDVLVNLVASDFLSVILRSQFRQPSQRHLWSELACGITSLPDIVSNCQALDKYPSLKSATFYELLIDSVYHSVVAHYAQLPPDSTHQEHKLFLLKLLGRVAISGFSQLVWLHFTQRAIQEPQNRVRTFCSELLKMAASPPNDHTSVGIFMDHFYLPIFMSLKPTRDSHILIGSFLNRIVYNSDQLRYLLCDKSIFKTNYNLVSETQAIVLFNIASYLSSLVTPQQPPCETKTNNEEYPPAPRSLSEMSSDHDDQQHQQPQTTTSYDNESEVVDGEKCSLLIETFLEVVRSWTNATKILVRTYQHNKYITSALLVLFRFALKHDRGSLIKHANEIQSMIARSIPIYLNRASPEQRNLASCMCELILPKLSELIIDGASSKAKGGVSTGTCGIGIAKDCEMKKEELLTLNISRATNQSNDQDDLYLQRLFQQDVDLLFQDVLDTNRLVSNKSRAVGPCLTNDSTRHREAEEDVTSKQKLAKRQNEASETRQQLQEDTKKLLNQNDEDAHGGDDDEIKLGAGDVPGHKRRALIELVDETKASGNSSHEATCSSCDQRCFGQDDDDDLIPYTLDQEDEDQTDDDDDDEYALGEDASNVPIYLRDCIDGLIENANYRYVRLCLIRAGVLIDKLIDQDDADATRRNQTVCLATRHSSEWSYGESDSGGSRSNEFNSLPPGVNDTIKDGGVELARCLLFLENQYGIEKFSEFRMNALVSLCTVGPELIGKYLIDELNSSSRSLHIQLDILHILVATASRLSFGVIATNPEEQTTHDGQQLIISSRKNAPVKKVNKFVPYASLFFYGISYRLKADFIEPGRLVMTEPRSIVSAFRTRIEPADGLANKTDHLEPEMIIEKMRASIHSESSQTSEDKRERQHGGAIRLKSVLSEDEEATFLERNSLSDDSYLLSRILFSISRVLRCAAQQPSTCKLSSDLLEILTAYRCHPDSGVQSAIVACLKMIRDCTPAAYYAEYIEKRMMHLFGAWLGARASSLQC